MQNPIVAFDPMTRIGKQMIESIQIHKKFHKNEILSMLEKMLIEFGMKDVHRIFHSFPSQLSGGMLQRLMIILALSLSPYIIIADEATIALDIKIQSTVLNDISVRKAVNHAINTESIRKNILGNIEQEATSILDKNLPYCHVDTGAYSYSEQKAKELLEKAGWKAQDGDGIREKDGVKLSVNISCASEQAMLKDISEAIATDLKKVGFETKTSSSETMNHFLTC